jgi:DNA-binding transcriptional regulator YdaS (Cro superfamily)
MTKERERACRHIKAAVAAAGGTGAAALKCGLTAQAVSDWIRRGCVPRRHISTLCLAGGGIVSKASLREAMMAADASEDVGETRGEI